MKAKVNRKKLIIFLSFVFVILIIASVLNNFMTVPAVAAGLMGIRAGVCALILKTVLNLRKKSLVDTVTTVTFLIALAILLFVDISPVVPVIIGAVVGIVSKSFEEKRKAGSDK